MRELENYKKYIDSLIIRYYKSYKSLFIKGGYDFADLQQEAYITFYEVLNKYNDSTEEKDFRYLLGNRISWRLWELKDLVSIEFRKPEMVVVKGKKGSKKKTKARKIDRNKSPEFQTYEEYVDELKEETNDHCSVEELLPFYIESNTSIDSLEGRLFLEDAKSILSEIEYQVFYLMRIEGYSSVETSKKINKSVGYLLRVLEKAIAKLKKEKLF